MMKGGGVFIMNTLREKRLMGWNVEETKKNRSLLFAKRPGEGGVYSINMSCGSVGMTRFKFAFIEGLLMMIWERMMDYKPLINNSPPPL